MAIDIILLVALAVSICINISRISIESKENKKFWKELKELQNPEEIKVKLIDGGKMPESKSDGAVCADAYARTVNHFIKQGERELVPLGFALELPDCYEAIVRPRSGNSKNGIDISIGTIDTDYRGEVMACVVNNSDKDFPIHNGDRICQIAIREVPEINFNVVEELSETERGSKGFGSSGTN